MARALKHSLELRSV